MRKQFLIMLTMMIALGLASCSEKDGPVVSPEDPSADNLKDVTIIWYGTGGANVDYAILDNFRQFYRAQLLINETEPPAWSPSSFKYQLPEDDMSGVPII